MYRQNLQFINTGKKELDKTSVTSPTGFLKIRFEAQLWEFWSPLSWPLSCWLEHAYFPQLMQAEMLRWQMWQNRYANVAKYI